jgi:hypothetical protein
MEPLPEVPAKKPRSKVRRAVYGTGVTLALLAGLEVAFATLADGALNPAWKTLAQAASLGIGAFIAAMRGA